MDSFGQGLQLLWIKLAPCWLTESCLINSILAKKVYYLKSNNNCPTMPDWFDIVFTLVKVFILESKAVVHWVYDKYMPKAKYINTWKTQSLHSALYQTLKHIQEVWTTLNLLNKQKYQSLDCAQTMQVYIINLFPIKTHSRGNSIKAGQVRNLHSLELFVSAAGSTLLFRLGSNVI